MSRKLKTYSLKNEQMVLCKKIVHGVMVKHNVASSINSIKSRQMAAFVELEYENQGHFFERKT